MIDLRTASRSAARVARHRRAAPASELALVVLYTQAAIVGGLFQACPTDSISHCRFQCYRPLGIANSACCTENDLPYRDQEINVRICSGSDLAAGRVGLFSILDAWRETGRRALRPLPFCGHSTDRQTTAACNRTLSPHAGWMAR